MCIPDCTQCLWILLVFGLLNLRRCGPRLSAEAADKLKNRYVMMRSGARQHERETSKRTSIPITVRWAAATPLISIALFHPVTIVKLDRLICLCRPWTQLSMKWWMLSSWQLCLASKKLILVTKLGCQEENLYVWGIIPPSPSYVCSVWLLVHLAMHFPLIQVHNHTAVNWKPLYASLSPWPKCLFLPLLWRATLMRLYGSSKFLLWMQLSLAPSRGQKGSRRTLTKKRWGRLNANSRIVSPLAQMSLSKGSYKISSNRYICIFNYCNLVIT